MVDKKYHTLPVMEGDKVVGIVGKEDVVFSDELNHASIIDGCRLAKTRVVRYKHCDPEDLQAKIHVEKNIKRKLIITDGVFSMEGDIAPLPKIVEIAAKYNAITMVDDAHGEGVLGRGGRGIVDHYNLHGKVDIEVGTMSKAFGVVGGYIAGAKRLTGYLSQKGRPFLFSGAVTAADVAACIAVVNTLNKSDNLVKKLWSNTRFFQDRVKQLGFNIGNTKEKIWQKNLSIWYLSLSGLFRGVVQQRIQNIVAKIKKHTIISNLCVGLTVGPSVGLFLKNELKRGIYGKSAKIKNSFYNNLSKLRRL